jgi:hypothetical protein
MEGKLHILCAAMKNNNALICSYKNIQHNHLVSYTTIPDNFRNF